MFSDRINKSGLCRFKHMFQKSKVWKAKTTLTISNKYNFTHNEYFKFSQRIPALYNKLDRI